MSELFNVVFAGQVVAGADPEAVRANVARLFKVNEAALEKLFSGQRIAVKKAVDQAGAMKLRAMLKQAGAVATLEACDEQGRPLAAGAVAPRPAAPVAAPVAAAPAQPAAPAPKQPSMAERIAAMAAADEKLNALKPNPDLPPPPADVKRVETWKMFPVGSVLLEASASGPVRAPLLPNISHFTLAKLGTELLDSAERKQLAPEPVVVPDLSAIKVAALGADVLKADEKENKAPVVVDISGMSMAPPNTDVLKPEEKRVVVPVVVDVSGITVAPPGVDLEQIREEKVLVNPDISKIKLA